MGDIPEDAKWYLAEIVVKITVEDDPRSVIHTNLVLVRADSPEEAFNRADELGRMEEDVIGYEIPDGKWVRPEFCGLRDLNVIHDELEHGAEIIFQEEFGLTDEEISEKISPKEELGVFRPIQRSTGPNYTSREILVEAMELLREKDGMVGKE